MDLKNPKVIVTDQDAALMAAIRKVFLHIINLLCLWHINKCVQTEWKLVFHDTKNPKRNEGVLSMQKQKKHMILLGLVYLTPTKKFFLTILAEHLVNSTLTKFC